MSGFATLPSTRRRLLRIAGASFVMAGLLRASALLQARDAPAHSLAQAISVLLTIAGGAAVYFALLALFGVASWRQTVDAIRRAKPRDLRS